jgi:DNA-binding NarL/FixJ family response regulator
VTLRLLLVEDNPADAEHPVEHLRSTGLHLTSRRVVAQTEFVSALSDFRPGVILFDHGLPGFSAPDALALLERERLPTPFIILTGALDEAQAVAAMRAGADDIVLKTRLARLRPALDRALALREGLRKLSPRQVEVLRLVAEGLTTPGIAEELGISAKTADTHRTEMMRRLDIHDVASLVRYAVQVRLIPRPG